jgi:Ca2+-binding RTX toxin-like protein
MGTKTTINGMRNHGVEIDDDHVTLIVGPKGVINATSEDEAVYFGEMGSSHNRLIVQGQLFATFTQDSYGIMCYSDLSSINVTHSGSVVGSNGISVYAENVKVNIAGQVNATGSEGVGLYVGIYMAPRHLDIDISGTISGFSAMDLYVTGPITNEASGRIVGAFTAIYIRGGELDLVNHGLIRSGNIAIYNPSDASQHIVNDGTIAGAVYLGAGDDFLDTRGGTIKGQIFGHDGYDILVTDNAKVHLTEFEDGGTDWVKSTVSYTLSDNVEVLTLLGKKNTNGTGNNDVDVNNYLYGNAGDNVLNGLGGFNKLFGRGGTDTLISGAGNDQFVIGKGFGHDTVKGFTDGTDGIDIYYLGPWRFGQVKSHIEQHGDDTWIKFGKDALILENIDHKVLDASDFVFEF